MTYYNNVTNMILFTKQWHKTNLKKKKQWIGQNKNGEYDTFHFQPKTRLYPLEK